MKSFLIILLLVTTYVPGFTQRYKRLHSKAVVADTHNDVLAAVINEGWLLEDDLRGKTDSDLARFKEGGVDIQVFAVWCDSTFGKDTAFKYANLEIDSLYAIANRNGDKMMLVRSQRELGKALKQKKLASMIGVEGGHMIEDNSSYLDSFYKRGARYLTLTWLNSTSWATSSLDESTDYIKNEKKGLNDFGKDLVKHMNELGMMVDVSHVGEQTFWDVLAATTKPVLASHSSVYSLTPHHRNLKDDQIRAIAKNGGVIQINFAPQFIDSTYQNRRKAFYLTHKGEIDSLRKIKYTWIGRYINTKYPEETNALRPPISLVFDHIDYIVKLVGVDYVGLGSDFDGTINTPHDLENVSKYPNITHGLPERGYSKRDIQKIMGGNFIRVFKANVQ